MGERICQFWYWFGIGKRSQRSHRVPQERELGDSDDSEMENLYEVPVDPRLVFWCGQFFLPYYHLLKLGLVVSVCGPQAELPNV